MLEFGIIEVLSSEWCSPTVLVAKKDGSLRFCIDFCYLNSVSVFDPCTVHRIDDLQENYITTLDLSNGYWLLALAQEARELTAFKTPYGMYQFRVMTIQEVIPQFAERSLVLNDLTRISAPDRVRWTDKCDQASRDLKEAICAQSVLYCPDYDKPFTLETDASEVGIGPVLLQEVDGDMKLVVFLSRKLPDRKTRYSTLEKKCL